LQLFVREDGSAACAVGQVFGYQGNPSWLFVVVYAPNRQTPLTGTLTTTDGRVMKLDLRLSKQQASWGGEIPIDLREVALVRLVDRGGNVYRARMPGGPGE
jgi:hypothetical protein